MTSQDFTCIPLAGWEATSLRLAVVLRFELVARVLRTCSLCIPSFQFGHYNHSMLVSFLLLGIMIVLSILWEAFEVMLLPLPVKRRFRLVRLFFHWTWKSWSVVASTVPLGQRAKFIGVYGPFSLVLLICFWVGGLIAGFALIHQSFYRDHTLSSLLHGLYFSGITFFTVGYGDLVPRTPGMKAAAVLEAGCGLGFLALVIGYLPVLYQLFARREAHVMLLDERAGSPPTATTLLKRHADGRSLESLQGLLREWELWAAELLESHMSYPMLVYYRSQYPNLSWLAALTAIMDTCSLIMVGFEDVGTFQARMSFSVARLAIIDLSQVLGISQVAIGKTRLPSEEFQRVKASLEESGLRLVEPDAELMLAKFRATYEPFLGGLGEYLMIDLPGWTASDDQLDNWERNMRGEAAKRLVESVSPEPNEESDGITR